MFLAANQSLQNTSKKKRKRRTAEDDPQEDSGEGTPPVRPLEPSASSDQLVGVGNGATCRVCKCPGRQSLTLVYIYLGALTLILASLSIVFYTHTQDVESLSQVEDNYSSKSFRVQFQAELMRSEEELRRLVNRIIEEEQELVGRWADH